MIMILSLHIAGAIASGGLVGLALWQSYYSRPRRWLVKTLGLAAGWQLASGLGLVLLSGSLTQFCLSGSLYMVVIGAAIAMLKRQPALLDA